MIISSHCNNSCDTKSEVDTLLCAASNKDSYDQLHHELTDVQHKYKQSLTFLNDQKIINRAQNQEIKYLEAQLRLMRHKRFAPSSEQLRIEAENERLPLIFNDAELESDAQEPDESEQDTTTVKSFQRKPRGKRLPLPANLPRKRIEVDLTDEQKICPCGCQLTKIGEDISEQLEIIPAQFNVLQTVRFKYACKHCEEQVRSADKPVQILPKSIAAPGLLAWLVVSKFVDALPLYRLEKIIKRHQVDVSRASLARWMIQIAKRLDGLMKILNQQLLQQAIIGMDETTVQVLNEPDRRAQTKSWMWVRQGGSSGQKIILFHYNSSRSARVAEELLPGFTGYLVTDAYTVYKSLSKHNGAFILVGCMAHARRKFVDALKAQGENPKVGSKSMQGVAYMKKLYAIEKKCKAMSADERHLQRQLLSRPILDAMHQWLIKSITQTPKKSLVHNALAYTHNHWQALTMYLEDGRLPIDNNATEGHIRLFAIGRKNWLFSATVNGAEASACLYSLVETAKANGLEPYWYLRHLFTELPHAQTQDALLALLPFSDNFNKDRLIRP